MWGVEVPRGCQHQRLIPKDGIHKNHNRCGKEFALALVWLSLDCHTWDRRICDPTSWLKETLPCLVSELRGSNHGCKIPSLGLGLMKVAIRKWSNQTNWILALSTHRSRDLKCRTKSQEVAVGIAIMAFKKALSSFSFERVISKIWAHVRTFHPYCLFHVYISCGVLPIVTWVCKKIGVSCPCILGDWPQGCCYGCTKVSSGSLPGAHS